MKNILRSMGTVALLALVFLNPAIGQSNADTSITYQSVFKQIVNNTKAIKEATVTDFSFQKDAAKFHLSKGTIYILNQVLGREAIVLFKGTGGFSFTPPTKIEQDQLFRFYEVRTLERGFDVLYMIFNDETLTKLQAELEFRDASADADFQPEIENCMKYLTDDDDYLRADIFRNVFCENKNGFFWAQFYGDASEPFFFKIDPYEREEVKFMHRADLVHFIKIPEIVCQYSRTETKITANNNDSKFAPFMKAAQYKIFSEIEDDLDFSANAEITFEVLRENTAWISFYLYDKIEVDSVISSSGTKLHFFKPEEHSNVWIRGDKVFEMNKPQTVNIYYHSEDLIEKDIDGWIYLKSASGWYPQSNDEEFSSFELTYKYPAKYKLISVGDNVSLEVNDNTAVSVWSVSQLTTNASFNIGAFSEVRIAEKNLPEIQILNFEKGHMNKGDIQEVVMQDVKGSMQFYKYIFGEIPINHLYIAEIPYLHGEAFTNLLHLSWATFEDTRYEGEEEMFRAHEVAHQWWGVDVGFETYHDQWLSEGISEFLSLWYMQTVLNDNDKYFNMLDEWKEAITSNRKYLFDSGQEAGPIWLGYRTSSSRTPGDYNLLIYEKAAWVLHMLRTMMIDPMTMNEDKFIAMLKDFYQSYRGKKANTKDFQAVVEKHTGMKMDWFFNQWIYNTEIPAYTFGYKYEKNAGGKYLVTCKVKTENVPAEFKAAVMLKIDFGNDQYSRTLKMVEGTSTEFQFLLPLEPEDIEFNHLDSVLAEVKNVDFDEL